MLSKEVTALEHENHVLRKALEELQDKMEHSAVLKPKSCQYCKNYVQHYIKGGKGARSEYTPHLRRPLRQQGADRQRKEAPAESGRHMSVFRVGYSGYQRFIKRGVKECERT